MKTIQVTDEVYEFLKSCQEELKTQDNRCTSNPIFGFIVEEKHASYDPQKFEFVNDDHTSTITNTERPMWEEELAEYIIGMYDDRSLKEIREILCEMWTSLILSPYYMYVEDNEFGEGIKKELTEHIKNLTWYEIEDFCDTFGIKRFGYEKKAEMYQESVSLFESDMQAHLDMNKHNMRDYHTYVFYNNRTPKMTKLRDILINEIKF